MKMKLQTYIAVTALVLAVSSESSLATLSAPLPEFKAKQEQKQLKRSESAYPIQAGTFYTGKPYEASREGYLFQYRNYNPELNRWASLDPSGFPDGANAFLYVNNQAMASFDPDGLTQVQFTGTTSITIPNTQVTLNPSMPGKFEYTMTDETGHHFKLDPQSWGSWVGPQSGNWAHERNDGSTFTFTTSTITLKENGTEVVEQGGGPGESLVKDYIIFIAYFDLAIVQNGTTSHNPYKAYLTEKIYGNPYYE